MEPIMKFINGLIQAFGIYLDPLIAQLFLFLVEFFQAIIHHWETSEDPGKGIWLQSVHHHHKSVLFQKPFPCAIIFYYCHNYKWFKKNPTSWVNKAQTSQLFWADLNFSNGENNNDQFPWLVLLTFESNIKLSKAPRKRWFLNDSQRKDFNHTGNKGCWPHESKCFAYLSKAVQVNALSRSRSLWYSHYFITYLRGHSTLSPWDPSSLY